MPTRRARLISKYHARPCVVDGIRFASAKEAKRYGELKILERVGQIRCLILQPKYHCSVKRLGQDPIIIGLYRGDFQYEDVATGARIVEDVKGFKTPLYRWKKKHVEAQYGIQIQEM